MSTVRPLPNCEALATTLGRAAIVGLLAGCGGTKSEPEPLSRDAVLADYNGLASAQASARPGSATPSAEAVAEPEPGGPQAVPEASAVATTSGDLVIFASSALRRLTMAAGTADDARMAVSVE